MKPIEYLCILLLSCSIASTILLIEHHFKTEYKQAHQGELSIQAAEGGYLVLVETNMSEEAFRAFMKKAIKPMSVSENFFRVSPGQQKATEGVWEAPQQEKTHRGRNVVR